jgi:hypothetical protein
MRRIGEILRDIWRAGLNDFPVQHIPCPIESVDLKGEFGFARSDPRVYLKSFVQQRLGRGAHEQLVFTVPRPADVDDELWMNLDGDKMELNDKYTPLFGPMNHSLNQTKGKSRKRSLWMFCLINARRVMKAERCERRLNNILLIGMMMSP